MSSLHNDLATWAAKAKAAGQDTIYLSVSTAEKAAEQIVSLSTELESVREAVNGHLKWFERFICDEDELNSSTPRKVSRNAKDAAEELRAVLAAPELNSAGLSEGEETGR